MTTKVNVKSDPGTPKEPRISQQDIQTAHEAHTLAYMLYQHLAASPTTPVHRSTPWGYPTARTW